MNDSISQAIEALCLIVPPCPGDSRNDSMVRRLEVLIGAAKAIARAFPDNGELGEAQGLDLTVQARTLAHLVDTRTQWCLPPGYNLPRCSEAALEASQ